MPCDTVMREAAARRERERQMKVLEERLKNKSARIARLGNAVSIEGWTERGGWCDACAVRALKQSSDFQIRQMVNTAVPTMAGITFGHGH